MPSGQFRLSDRDVAYVYLGLTIAGVNVLVAIGLLAVFT